MKLNEGQIKGVSLFSKSLNQDVELIIYLPVTYSPLYKYSLLIAQDGQDYFSLGRIARVAEELMQSGKIDETIIIGIPYCTVNERKELYHPEGSKHQKYIRFMGEDLVTFLDKNFPTYQIGSSRTLIGDSLGGTVSLLSALSYPHTFSKVIMQSPYVDNHVLKLTEDFPTPDQLELYHVVGKQETAVNTTDGQVIDFIAPNRLLHQIIKKKSFPFFYDEFDGEHTWTNWQPDLPRALQKMLRL